MQKYYLFLKILPFNIANDDEQLVFEPLGRDRKINDGRLHEYFRQIVRIRQFGGDVKTEIMRIQHVLIVQSAQQRK